MSDTLTKRDYENAIYAQSAVNLLALSNSLTEVLRKLPDSPARNDHPIVRLYLHQMMFLAHKCEWEPGSPRYYEDTKAVESWIANN